MGGEGKKSIAEEGVFVQTYTTNAVVHLCQRLSDYRSYPNNKKGLPFSSVHELHFT